MKKWILSLFLLIPGIGYTSSFPLKGKIYKSSDSLTTLDQVIVLKKGNQTGVLTRIDGHFQVYVNLWDTLLFLRKGYFNDTLIVLQVNPDEIHIYMQEIPVTLKGITFRKPPIINLEERRKEWAYILDRPKAGVQSPVTALYEQFSKKGKELRKLEKYFYEDEKKIYSRQRVTRILCFQITQLTGKQLDSFMVFATPPYEILVGMSEVQLILHLQHAFKNWNNGIRRDYYTPTH